MSMGSSQEELRKNEQEILDKLLQEMDQEMLRLNEDLTEGILEAKKAKEQCLPDTYGMLIDANDRIKSARISRTELNRSKDELYDHRMVLSALTDDQRKLVIDLKIGLHTFSAGGRIFVCSWNRKICRHYLLDNSAIKYENDVPDKYGNIFHTTYTLQLKRKIDLRFEQVKKVRQLFPVDAGESEKIISDEFLEELAERRTGQEFKNIIFSIQKKQGEIIQTPYNQNIIVQGCAGSGKSMIMLHRLPILLFDNPDKLGRNLIYIISPSKAYIQMAENMRDQLEISDLKMGTMQEYFDLSIKKYGVDTSKYGTINSSVFLTKEQNEYVYSDRCVKDIQSMMQGAISQLDMDYSNGKLIFQLDEKKKRKSDFPYDTISSKILESQKIINNNNNSLRQYYNAIRDVMTSIDELQRFLANRNISVVNEINKLISTEDDDIKRSKEIIQKLDKTRNLKSITNQETIITTALKRIEQLEKEKANIENDKEYFDTLNNIRNKLVSVFALFKDFKMNFEDNRWESIYEYISKIGNIIGNFYETAYNLSRVQDKYAQYESSPNLCVNCS